MSVLLLNADAQPVCLLPLSIISWQSAVKAYFADKVRIVKNYDDRVLHSARMEMPMPSVVMLKRYHKQPTRAKFTRRNLFVRDNFMCQYCGDQPRVGDLTIDHVLPRSHGGRTNWTNCTTACRSCNTKKSNNPHIKPDILPFQPTWHDINYNAKFFRLHIPDASWQDFLQWPEELLIINENPSNIHCS
jgi:5-methylcytosine-specific restriction endonuclease McrA